MSVTKHWWRRLNLRGMCIGHKERIGAVLCLALWGGGDARYSRDQTTGGLATGQRVFAVIQGMILETLIISGGQQPVVAREDDGAGVLPIVAMVAPAPQVRHVIVAQRDLKKYGWTDAQRTPSSRKEQDTPGLEREDDSTQEGL